jgi:hypothetical protein
MQLVQKSVIISCKSLTTNVNKLVQLVRRVPILYKSATIPPDICTTAYAVRQHTPNRKKDILRAVKLWSR